MSCINNILPMYVSLEKADSPGNYLGFNYNCDIEGGLGAYQGFSSTYTFSDNSNYGYGGGTSRNQESSIISIKIAGVDDYGNIFADSIHKIEGGGGWTTQNQSYFQCSEGAEYIPGVAVETLDSQGSYEVITQGWDPCYTWPNGYRGTRKVYRGTSKSNQVIKNSNPCGSSSSASNGFCSFDGSRFPFVTSPEGCVFVGESRNCDTYRESFSCQDCVAGGSYSSNTNYRGKYNNEADIDSFYSNWMKKSAEKILKIKENNDKKNCCPGSGYPKPCDNNTDWYEYPYSRPAYGAPEGSEFIEEFLNGNCWQGVGTIEIKNPKVSNLGAQMQAFKFNVAIDVTNMGEYEQSQIAESEGELVLYTPDPNYDINDPQAPNPCCNSCGCFAGKILKTLRFKNLKAGGIRKSQKCPYSFCQDVRTYVFGDLDEIIYNEDLYSLYLEQEWDETAPSFYIKGCIKEV